MSVGEATGTIARLCGYGRVRAPDSQRVGIAGQCSMHELYASRLPRAVFCSGREPARGAGDHRRKVLVPWLQLSGSPDALLGALSLRP